MEANILALILVAGTYFYGFFQPGLDAKKCHVTVGNVEVKSVFPKPVILVPVQIKNPGKRTVKIGETYFKLYIQDSFVGDCKIPPMNINPGETRTEKVSLNIPAVELLIPVLMGFLQNNSIEVRVEGNINYKTMVGNYKIPFNYTKTITSPQTQKQ